MARSNRLGDNGVAAVVGGLVAAQDVDRFFRDLTQIETNIFIDACRRNKAVRG